MSNDGIFSDDQLRPPPVDEPGSADERSALVFVRAGGQEYSVKVRRTLPISEATVLRWPMLVRPRGETFGDFLTAVENQSSSRPIWYLRKDFIKVPLGVVLHLNKPPREYQCLKVKEHSRLSVHLGDVIYTGPSPNIGHGVGQFEACVGGLWITCDRTAEAQHLLALAAGLVEQAPNVFYLCELPEVGQ